MTQCYLNGRFVPLEKACISPMDRGFLFGDGVYEVIPVYARRPFRLDEHLARLDKSLAAISLANPHPLETWREIVARLIEQAAWEDQSVYLQVTRGPMAVNGPMNESSITVPSPMASGPRSSELIIFAPGAICTRPAICE